MHTSISKLAQTGVTIDLKGPCHEIFELRFFSSNNSIWALDPWVKAFLHTMTSYLRRYSTMKSIFCGVSSVNDTADHYSAVSMTPLTRVVESELFDWIQIHTLKNPMLDLASI
jgi:hypothetical protein